MVKHCTAGARALDIGCNAGYFSKALLAQGLVQQIDAIEYDASIVTDALKNDERFSLFEGDATDFVFEHQYDVVVYGAVHHHIFAQHGYARAMKFWNEIIDHTGSQIFIESGQLGEGSRWYWQRALRSYYSTDEQYYGELLYAIGPRMKSVTLVGRHWIHGVRRWLLKIELWPPSRHADSKLNAAPSVKSEQVFRRTIGSVDQQLLSNAHTQDLPIHEGVTFRIATTADDDKVFCKQYVSPKMEAFEDSITGQVNDDRFVTPIGVSSDLGLVFPFVEAGTLASTSRDAVKDKDSFRRQLLSLYAFAKEKEVILDFAGERSLRLIDIIDFHPSNLFYDERTQKVQVCDLEFYSMRNSARNRLSFMKMIFKWGPRNFATLASLLSAAVVRILDFASFLASPPENRIRDRVGSVVSWTYGRLREKLDRVVAVFIPSYWQ